MRQISPARSRRLNHKGTEAQRRIGLPQPGDEVPCGPRCSECLSPCPPCVCGEPPPGSWRHAPGPVYHGDIEARRVGPRLPLFSASFAFFGTSLGLAERNGRRRFVRRCLGVSMPRNMESIEGAGSGVPGSFPFPPTLAPRLVPCLLGFQIFSSAHPLARARGYKMRGGAAGLQRAGASSTRT